MTSSKKQSSVVKNLAISAVLTALGILIPLIMPAKIVIGPASYTLASHVPIMIAMFISPFSAVIVALGTTLGFFIAGFPFVIVLRALSHLLFVVVGTYLLQKYQNIWQKPVTLFSVAFGLNVLHALGEMAAVYAMTATAETTSNYWFVLFVLIGLGTIVHGMVDFIIAYWIFRQVKGIIS